MGNIHMEIMTNNQETKKIVKSWTLMAFAKERMGENGSVVYSPNNYHHDENGNRIGEPWKALRFTNEAGEETWANFGKSISDKDGEYVVQNAKNMFVGEYEDGNHVIYKTSAQTLELNF